MDVVGKQSQGHKKNKVKLVSIISDCFLVAVSYPSFFQCKHFFLLWVQ